MASLFKRAALAFGRFTGRRTRPEPTDVFSMTLIEPAPLTSFTGEDPTTTPAPEPIDELIEKSGQIPPLDENVTTVWDEALTTPEITATSTEAVAETATADEGIAVTASLYEAAGPVADEATVTETSSAIEGSTTADAAAVTEVTEDFAPIPLAPVAEFEPVIVSEAAVETPAAVAAEVEEPKAPIEIKPEPSPLTTLAGLYDLIGAEVDKRNGNTLAVYERLLAATREELESTRRNNRLAWSVGGVMSAVAAFGAVWSSGEFAANHTELGALKQQVNVAQQASADRDQLRNELSKVREASAKIEVDALKARLDQALAISAERDRLTGEIERVRRDRLEVESELRLARATATTQPVSDARSFLEKTTARTTVAATAGDKAAGAERPDVWSSLLNGRD